MQMPKKPYYIYAPKNVLQSIKHNGYLSVLAQKKQFGYLSAEIIRKYKQQMEEAADQYAELKELLKNETEEQQILLYLDWRMKDEIPSSKRGSNAIYILYYPIPNEQDIVEFVTKKRKFATDRVLLSGETTAAFYPIPSKDPPTAQQQTDRAFWVQQWRNQMALKDQEDALWLQGIPHACFFPAEGRIDFFSMRVEDQLFQ